MLRLILGGQASGKSDHALALFAGLPGPKAFLATGRALDAGFAAQIKAHRQSRDPLIPVVETGLDLPAHIGHLLHQGTAVLADSLDFWVFACLEAGESGPRAEELLEVLAANPAGETIIVSCETGLSPVAGDGPTRRFVRELGALNRRLAAIAGEVWLVAAGLPLALKRT